MRFCENGIKLSYSIQKLLGPKHNNFSTEADRYLSISGGRLDHLIPT